MVAEAASVVGDGAMVIPKAAAFSGLSRSYLYMLMDRGELRYIKVGRRRLIPRADLVRLLGEGLVGSEARAAGV